MALVCDLYADGIVIWCGVFGVCAGAPAFPEAPPAPAATGLLGMGIGELIIQPLNKVGNLLGTGATACTLVSDTKTGKTIVEKGKFSSSTLNSALLSTLCWMCSETFISTALQTVAVLNDLGKTSIPFPKK